MVPSSLLAPESWHWISTPLDAKAQGTLTLPYVPIIWCWKKERMKYKFEICYVRAREGLAFLKYPLFHALAEQQGVELGSFIKTTDSAKVFTDFIAESLHQYFCQSLSMSSTLFLSFLIELLDITCTC